MGNEGWEKLVEDRILISKSSMMVWDISYRIAQACLTSGTLLGFVRPPTRKDTDVAAEPDPRTWPQALLTHHSEACHFRTN